MSDAKLGLFYLLMVLCNIQLLLQQPNANLRLEQGGMGQRHPGIVCISD